MTYFLFEADACWALSYLTDGDNDRIEAVVQSGVVPNLIHLLASGDIPVMTPSLRAIGNIVTGSDEQTDAVIKNNGLTVIGGLLRHPKMNIVKEAAWTVSNVTAGNQQQIQAVIEAGIIEPLIEVLIRVSLKHVPVLQMFFSYQYTEIPLQGDFKAQKEAAWAVTNLTSGGTIEQIIVMCHHGVLKPFCDLLSARDEKTVSVVLDGISNILQAAEKFGEAEKVATMIEECGGLDNIEMLQNHDNEEIYKKSLTIIEAFFGEEVSYIFIKTIATSHL